MKTRILIAFALLCAAIASAADITLRDGRVLENAVVLKQDAATITVRYAAGFTQVDKSKLPDDLAVIYPIDLEAAQRERDQQAAEITKRAEETQRANEARKELARLNPDKPAPEPVEKMAYAKDDISNPSRSRGRYWGISRSAQLPEGFNAEWASWSKLYDGAARGSPMDSTIKITKKIVRIRCQFYPVGRYAYLSVRVMGDTDCAIAWMENSGSGSAYGIFTGDATLTISSNRGSWSVIVEESDG